LNAIKAAPGAASGIAGQLSAVSQFVMASIKPPTPSNLTTVRKLNPFEDLMNLIESPVAPPVDSSPFAVAKLEFEINLAELIWTVTNSCPPEMQDEHRMPVYSAMEAAIREMKAAPEKALRRAVRAAAMTPRRTFSVRLSNCSTSTFANPSPRPPSSGRSATVPAASQSLVITLTFDPGPSAAGDLPDLRVPFAKAFADGRIRQCQFAAVCLKPSKLERQARRRVPEAQTVLGPEIVPVSEGTYLDVEASEPSREDRQMAVCWPPSLDHRGFLCECEGRIFVSQWD
jgi:hypothetical protein